MGHTRHTQCPHRHNTPRTIRNETGVTSAPHPLPGPGHILTSVGVRGGRRECGATDSQRYEPPVSGGAFDRRGEWEGHSRSWFTVGGPHVGTTTPRCTRNTRSVPVVHRPTGRGDKPPSPATVSSHGTRAPLKEGLLCTDFRILFLHIHLLTTVGTDRLSTSIPST